MACMVRAYHAIFGVYGFWLPNDPRGSWSAFVRRWELVRFGKATKVTTRESLAFKPHDHSIRRKAKSALLYPPVTLTGPQARCVGLGFRNAVNESGYHVLACIILPEHVHVVIGRCGRRIERIVGHLKGAAARALVEEQRHSLADFQTSGGETPSLWARGCWKVFLNSDAQIEKAVAYVEENPIKEGKPAQQWSFVNRYYPV